MIIKYLWRSLVMLKDAKNKAKERKAPIKESSNLNKNTQNFNSVKSRERSKSM